MLQHASYPDRGLAPSLHCTVHFLKHLLLCCPPTVNGQHCTCHCSCFVTAKVPRKASNFRHIHKAANGLRSQQHLRYELIFSHAPGCSRRCQLSLYQLCPHVAWADAVHCDPFGGYLQCSRSCETCNSMFCSAIWRFERRGDLAVERSDIDDAAPACVSSTTLQCTRMVTA
jgi:hypothetical protein